MDAMKLAVLRSILKTLDSIYHLLENNFDKIFKEK